VPGARRDPSAVPSKSDRTRARIIEAAARTLSRLGYAGTRLVDVAAEAGVQAPAIYYYFGSRDDLIAEVIVVGTIRLREQVETALAQADPSASALDRLDLAVEGHLRQLLTEASFAHAVIRNVGQLPEAIRARQLVEERRYASIWRGLFAEARADGSLRPGLDPELARLLTIGSLNWVVEWWSPRRSSLDELVDTAQGVVRHGISA